MRYGFSIFILRLGILDKDPSCQLLGLAGTLGGRLLYVDAPVEARFSKLQERNRDDAVYAILESFQAHERLELEGLLGPDSPHLRAVQAIADVNIINPFDDAYIGIVDVALGLPLH